METEKIDVPKFEGWEAFYGQPQDHEGCRILNDSGDRLCDPSGCEEYVARLAQICYRKIKPKRIVFERVGPGIPNAGEWVRTDCGDFIKLNCDRSTECDIWHIVEEQS